LSIEVISPTAEVIAIPREVIGELIARDHHVTRCILGVVSGYLRNTIATTRQSTAAQTSATPGRRAAAASEAADAEATAGVVEQPAAAA